LRVVENALRAAERGAALVRQLLAFSRKQTLMPEALDLNHLAAGMRDLLRRTLGADIEIEMSCTRTCGRRSPTGGQIENALLNLALNARDVMPSGAVSRSRRTTQASMRTMHRATTRRSQATT